MFMFQYLYIYHRTAFNLTAFAGSIGEVQRLATLIECISIQMGCILVDFRTTNLFQAPHKTIPDGLHWIGIFHFTKVKLFPVKDLHIDRGTSRVS